MACVLTVPHTQRSGPAVSFSMASRSLHAHNLVSEALTFSEVPGRTKGKGRKREWRICCLRPLQADSVCTLLTTVFIAAYMSVSHWHFKNHFSAILFSLHLFSYRKIWASVSLNLSFIYSIFWSFWQINFTFLYLPICSFSNFLCYNNCFTQLFKLKLNYFYFITFISRLPNWLLLLYSFLCWFLLYVWCSLLSLNILNIFIVKNFQTSLLYMAPWVSVFHLSIYRLLFLVVYVHNSWVQGHFPRALSSMDILFSHILEHEVVLLRNLELASA